VTPWLDEPPMLACLAVPDNRSTQPAITTKSTKTRGRSGRRIVAGITAARRDGNHAPPGREQQGTGSVVWSSQFGAHVLVDGAAQRLVDRLALDETHLSSGEDQELGVFTAGPRRPDYQIRAPEGDAPSLLIEQ
jgi:hypothetical protein